ncbi:MAG: ribbon-helix-helix protein, CopG family [Candidatus Portnoybacteria bacterium]|nr:ribbon-helix-helix protein, CopG family [Candidatus Portnoybacteria bacterium]
MRHIINISLPLELKREVDKAVKQEKYATKSEFFRVLLRMWQRQKTVQAREEEIDFFTR